MQKMHLVGDVVMMSCQVMSSPYQAQKRGSRLGKGALAMMRADVFAFLLNK